MDYDYILQKVYKKTEFFIIKKFKEFKADNRTFIYSIDEIRVFISNYNYRGNIGNNSSLFESCHRYYNQHTTDYEKGTPISKTIDRKVKDEFIKVTKEKKPLDKNYKEIDNYRFNVFIHDLIRYDFLRKVETRLSENSNLYELYFKNEDYTDFTLEKFDGHVINSELYKKLFSKFYPNKSLPIAVKKVTEWGNVVYDIFIDNIKVDNPLENDNSIVKSSTVNLKKIEDKTSQIDSKFTLLTNEEKILLLSIVYDAFTKNFDIEKPNKIPLTDFARVIYLTKDCVDINIFDKNYASRTFYKRLSKGNLYSDSSLTREKLIASLLNKIEILNLNSLKDVIDNEKTKTTKRNKN